VTEPVDVTDLAAMTRLRERTVVARGRVDILVGAVGGFAAGSLLETDGRPGGGCRLNLHERLRRDESRRAAHGPAPLRAHRPRRLARGRGAAGRRLAYTVSKVGVTPWPRLSPASSAPTAFTVNAVLPSTMAPPANRAGCPTATAGRVPVEAVPTRSRCLAREQSAHITGTLLAV